jgi:hypothetical protein
MITFKAIPNKQFFDRAHIAGIVGKQSAGALKQCGASVRMFAQRSMRWAKAGKASGPGRPPSAHRERGGLLRKLMYSAFERTGYASGSVIVGPVGNGKSPTRTVPHIQEFGGVQSGFGKAGPIVRKFPSRPYMGPALDGTYAKFPDKWKDSLQR